MSCWMVDWYVRVLQTTASVGNDLDTIDILEDPSVDFQLLENDQGLDSSELQCLQGIFNTIANTS
jgi:hypothetical protein